MSEGTRASQTATVPRKSDSRVASGAKDEQQREKLQGVARGGLRGCRERASAVNFQMASQHLNPPAAQGVTLVLEAQTSEGHTVSKVLPVLVPLKWVRGESPARGELVFLSAVAHGQLWAELRVELLRLSWRVMDLKQLCHR